MKEFPEVIAGTTESEVLDLSKDILGVCEGRHTGAVVIALWSMIELVFDNSVPEMMDPWINGMLERREKRGIPTRITYN